MFNPKSVHYWKQSKAIKSRQDLSLPCFTSFTDIYWHTSHICVKEWLNWLFYLTFVDSDINQTKGEFHMIKYARNGKTIPHERVLKMDSNNLVCSFKIMRCAKQYLKMDSSCVAKMLSFIGSNLP